MNGKNGTLMKASLAIVVAVVVATSGLVFNNTYQGMRRDVDHNATELTTKADTAAISMLRAIMTIQHEAVLREFQLLHEELRER